MLCVDRKISSKALVARLQKFLPSVLQVDLVRDLIENCNSKNLPPAIISLDQEKAFDQVNWSFFDRVLQKMNLGPEFKQWIGVIYSEISSACPHSDFVSSFFVISRDAQQGAPCLPVVYPGC